MQTLYYCLSAVLIIASVIPVIPNQHWFFRIFDFLKIQLLVLQTIVFILAWWFVPYETMFYCTQLLLLICMIYEISLIYQYTPLYKVKGRNSPIKPSKSIKVISANVYQFNTEYDRFIRLIDKYQPNVILTMESDEKWQQAMQVFKKDYPYFIEVPLQNTYGIHLYSNVKITASEVHYFVADDIPSIEAKMKTADGYEFVFFGVHPPPPSPTEEDTSKERDGELLSVAKKVKEIKIPAVVVGDFNNVAWGRSSVLFKNTAEMIDPRIGRGFISTFHAKYRLLRFPIDQMYHSSDIFIEDICTKENFGSDHLPLYFEFFIDELNPVQEEQVEVLEADEKQEVEQMIKDGKEEESDREKVVTE